MTKINNGSIIYAAVGIKTDLLLKKKKNTNKNKNKNKAKQNKNEKQNWNKKMRKSEKKM